MMQQTPPKYLWASVLGLLSIFLLVAGLVLAIGSRSPTPSYKSAGFTAIGQSHPPTKVQQVTLGIQLFSTSPSDYRALYSEVSYPLSVRAGQRAQVTLRLSVDEHIISSLPISGIGLAAGAAEDVLIPADPGSNYDDIYAKVDTVDDQPDASAKSTVWQLVSPPQQSLLEDATPPIDGLKKYKREVEFTWDVYAITSGMPNSVQIAYTIYWRGAGLAGQSSEEKTPHPVPILLDSPPLWIQFWLWLVGGGIIAFLAGAILASNEIRTLVGIWQGIIGSFFHPQQVPPVSSGGEQTVAALPPQIHKDNPPTTTGSP